MSIGHRLAEDELIQATVAELYSTLGEGDTPDLYQRSFKLDTDHDIPAGGGNSLDRKIVYIDRTLYQACMDGGFKATGLEPQQIIDRWCDHEHSEVCISDGDNPVEIYLPCHRRALCKEHLGVLTILGTKDAEKKIRNYEAVTWPAILRCYHKPITRPAKDLWCAPYLDNPTERDKEILTIFRKAGVIDADKRSKYDLHYGPGPQDCDQCSGWHPELISQQHGQLAACHRVCGLVRRDRHCDMWMPKQSA